MEKGERSITSSKNPIKKIVVALNAIGIFSPMSKGNIIKKRVKEQKTANPPPRAVGFECIFLLLG